MLNKRVLTLMTSAILIGTMAVGCSGKSTDEGSAETPKTESTKITVSGSTSVGPAMELTAEAFQESNEGVTVEVQQIGSSAGIKNAIEGVSEIGMASRELKDEEKNSGVKEFTMAYDGIAVITHKNNPVKDLTIEQVKDIYTGKITNWKDVGGNDSPIVVVSREDGSGTRGAFEEIIGFESGELVSDATIGDGNGNVKTTVEGNENAIGYNSFSYLDDSIQALNIEGVEPTAENVKDGTYKVSRPFLLVYKEGNISEKGKELLNFIEGEEGQKIVEEEGLITIK